MASKADVTAVNTIRTLAVDVVGKANSGHPGAPMGLAPAAHVLWTRHLKFSSKNSKWFNRDRFVLSNGHACALQYIMLHLCGYKVTMDDLKSFRQIDSNTPGHPELGVTDGIEVTTGPLGQGISNAVGMAIAQAHMGATFNKDGFPMVTNHTYAFMGDGCLQEGVSGEACSLAGHLQLSNLIAIYDDNHVTIDGNTNLSFTENVEQRFKSYGWNVIHVEHAEEEYDAIDRAFTEAKKNTNAPTMINLKTIIGYGSLLAGTGAVHGSPLKKDDIVQLKKKFGFNPDETFVVPKEVSDFYANLAEDKDKEAAEWNELFKKYESKYPKEASELQRRIEGRLPEGWEKALPTYKPSDAAVASRKLSETVITKIVEALPEIMVGSADLTSSNLTRWKGAEDFQHPSTGLGSYAGRYFRFGVREHAMEAICNGIAAYGGLIPLPSTFLNFVSYAAGAVRLSALSHLRVITVATHDSIGLGEDGPTHQPVETAAWLRAVPNLAFWRPADGNETSGAYLVAIMSQHTPSVLAFSRQNLPQLANSSIEKTTKGGYVVEEFDNADMTLVSTGSEVGLCVEAAQQLKDKGITARIVSIPCFEIFAAQSQEYKLSVLPSGHPIMSVEAYSTFGWGQLSHDHFGLKAWGASGPYDKVYAKYEITPAGIAQRAEKVVAFYKKRGQPLFSPLISALDDISE